MEKIFTLRPAIPQDAPILTRIASGAYSPYIPLMGREPAPMGADYASHIAQDICFVAVSDKQLVAFAVLISKAYTLSLHDALPISHVWSSDVRDRKSVV